MHPRAEQLIAELRLDVHPEGGFYRELFRSRITVLPADGRAARAALTTIYFLLTDEMVSRWHCVRSDEVWHLYEGGPLEMLELDLTMPSLARHRLADVGDDGALVHTIPADRWQAARSIGSYALVGCSAGQDSTLLIFSFSPMTLMRQRECASAGRSLRGTVSEDQLLVQVTMFFCIVTLVLAALGLYGVTAYSISQRTSEFGLRAPLGAEPSAVTRMVLGEASGWRLWECSSACRRGSVRRD